MSPYPNGTWGERVNFSDFWAFPHLQVLIGSGSFMWPQAMKVNYSFTHCSPYGPLTHSSLFLFSVWQEAYLSSSLSSLVYFQTEIYPLPLKAVMIARILSCQLTPLITWATVLLSLKFSLSLRKQSINNNFSFPWLRPEERKRRWNFCPCSWYINSYINSFHPQPPVETGRILKG